MKKFFVKLVLAAAGIFGSVSTLKADQYTFYGEATQTIVLLQNGYSEVVHGFGNLTYTTNTVDNTLSFSNGVYSGSDLGTTNVFGNFTFGNLPGITANSDYSGSLAPSGAFTLNGSTFAFTAVGGGIGPGTFVTDPFGFTSTFGANPPTPGTVLYSTNQNTQTGTDQLNVYVYTGGPSPGPLVAYSEDRTITVLASPVPEPSSFALLGIGGIGLALGAYRRRRLASV